MSLVVEASPLLLHSLGKVDALLNPRNVVILGASGNVGMFAIQFAKHRGALVVAIASGRDGTAFARRLGADVAIDGKRANIAKALRDFDLARDRLAGGQTSGG